jgi:hypothetical protein
MFCGISSVLAIIVIFLGSFLMLGGFVVNVIWFIILIITLVSSGGPLAAAYCAASWWVPLVGFGIMFGGFCILSLGYLLLWGASMICSTRNTSGMSGTSNLAGNPGSKPFGSFSFPMLGFPTPIGFSPDSILSLFSMLLISDDQRLKLPVNILEFIDCLRSCMCKTMCKGSDSLRTGDSGQNPGEVIVDTTKSLLEDLQQQLANAVQKLADANPLQINNVVYWTNKIADLKKQIDDL